MNAKRERNKKIMESILCGLLGALSVALGMYIGFYMSKAKEKDESDQGYRNIPHICILEKKDRLESEVDEYLKKMEDHK